MQADALTGPGDSVDELENRGNKIIFALFPHCFLIIRYMLSLTNTHYLVCGLYISDVKVLTAPTYSETVLLGKKLGCKVSIRSTSSHTTLIRTCCLLNSLDLSAEQWQLSMIRSGQFLLLRLDLHSRTITHNKVSALIVDWDNLKYKKKKGEKRKETRYFQVMSSQLLWQTGTISHWLPLQ